MYDIAAERVAKRWIETTTDTELKAVDFGGLLEFIKGLMAILMPLFGQCRGAASRIRSRAARWEAGLEGTQRLRILDRWALGRWQDRFDEKLGPRFSRQINNKELQLASLHVVANSTDEEVEKAMSQVKRDGQLVMI